MTPFSEGRLAGYRDAPKVNPYRRGVRIGFAIVEAAAQWDAGYDEGQLEGRDDVVSKHRENCR